MYQDYFAMSVSTLIIGIINLLAALFTSNSWDVKKPISFLAAGVVLIFGSFIFVIQTNNIKDKAIPSLQSTLKIDKAAQVTHGVMFNLKDYNYEGYEIQYIVVDNVLIWKEK